MRCQCKILTALKTGNLISDGGRIANKRVVKLNELALNYGVVKKKIFREEYSLNVLNKIILRGVCMRVGKTMSFLFIIKKSMQLAVFTTCSLFRMLSMHGYGFFYLFSTKYVNIV